MARDPDFAKFVTQTLGRELPSHFPISDELPSLFHSLIARLDETDARRIAKRYPSQPTGAQNRAAPIAADAYFRPDEADRRGSLFDDHQRQIRRKANAFLARAEEVRTAAESMQSPSAREGMFRLAETYQKVARRIIQGTGIVKRTGA
jgi:hypothetical protein